MTYNEMTRLMGWVAPDSWGRFNTGNGVQRTAPETRFTPLGPSAKVVAKREAKALRRRR